MLLALGAAALFAAAWWLESWLAANGAYGRLTITDIPVYQRFADAIAGGQIPYRDVEIEYPPLALPVFLLPRWLSDGSDAGYRAAFGALMVAVGMAGAALTTVAAARSGAAPGRAALAGGLYALSPLLAGPIILTRFDLWPALLVSATLAAVLAGRHRVGALLLGLGIGAKLWPIVLVPILAIHVWRVRGRGETVRSGAILAATILVMFLPFVLLAGAGALLPAVFQLGRPLQVESLGAAVLFVAHSITGLEVQVVNAYGLQALSGGLADTLKLALGIASVGAVAGIWAWFARGRPDPGRLLAASAAVVAALIVTDSTISPQYVIWLLPVIPLVRGRSGLAAMGALVLVLLLTASYFPSRYFDLVQKADAGVAWTVLVRDLLIGSMAIIPLVSWSPVIERARRAWSRIRHAAVELTPGPMGTLLIVLVGAFLLRAFWLDRPAGALIFDEKYYVNAARQILGWHMDADVFVGTMPGLDPNTEHPPLAKVLMAASMMVFGDTALGWRLPTLIAGMAALVAVFGIVRAAGGSWWTGVLAVAIYALDVLSFLHGRVGVLDMVMLGFALVGAWAALRRMWLLAGVLLALAMLVKITAAFLLLGVLLLPAVVAWRALRAGGRRSLGALRPILLCLGAWAVVGFVGLWLLDLRYTTYATPIDHIARMLGYGFALHPQYSPSSIASQPWDWLVNNGGFDYFRVDVKSSVGDKVVNSVAAVQFHAILNPILIGSLVPVVLLTLSRLRERATDAVSGATDAVGDGSDTAPKATAGLDGWALAWMAAAFLPFVALALLSNRIMYFYYVLPFVPALAIATAVTLRRLPRLVTWGYLTAMAAGFVAYFPFRQLP